MKAVSLSHLARILPVTLIITSIAWVWLQSGWHPLLRSSSPNRPSVRHSLLERLLLQDHEIIPASNGYFSYRGHWSVWRDQTSRTASLPGAYVQFTLTNSTSLYLNLHNGHPPNLSNETGYQVQRANVPDNRYRSASPSGISLIVQIQERDPALFNNTGDRTLRVANDLQRTKDYTVRATLLIAPIGSYMGTLDFWGIWLSKGGHLLPSRFNEGSPPGTLLGQERIIEVVSALPFSRATDAVSAYPVLLAKAFNMSHSLVPTLEHCLTNVCPNGTPSFQSLYFHTIPSGARPFGILPQHNKPIPIALILSLGLADFHHFLAFKRSSQEVSKHMDGFVNSYAEFVTAIRSASHNYVMAASVAEQSMGGVGASYAYNSAPNTLPIFLLTPFTPDRRLRRLLGHGVSAVARILQADGDKATIWVDTEGWLSAQDFRAPNNETQGFEDMNESGHATVATILSTHVCPYLKADCNFFRHEAFSGDLYVPSEAALGKLMEERKVTLVKSMLGMS